MRLSPLIVLCFSLFCGYASAMCRTEPDGTFLPDPSSRQRFIYCWQGEMIPGYCPPNEEFDPFDRVCEVPRWNSPPIIQTTTPSSPLDPCVNKPDGTFLPDPGSRIGFLYCWNGMAIAGECPAGKFFDPVERFCEVDNVAKDPCFGRPDNTLLPDPTSNRRFLFCRSGSSTPAYCPDDMIFYPEELYCDYKEETTPIPVPTRPPPPAPTTRSTTRAPPPNTTRTTARPPTQTTRRTPPPPTTTRRPQQTTRPPAPTRPGQTTRAPPAQPTRPGPPQPTRQQAGGQRPQPTRRQ